MRTFPKPQWTGREDLTGKTILLHTEGGFGDAFHFLRYVPIVVVRVRVLLECEPTLFPLFNGYPGVASTHLRGSALPAFDYFSALQSLPKAFDTILRTIPATVPYLWAPPALVDAWRKKLGPPRGLRVGLSWCGSRDLLAQALAHSGDFLRSSQTCKTWNSTACRLAPRPPSPGRQGWKLRTTQAIWSISRRPPPWPAIWI